MDKNGGFERQRTGQDPAPALVVCRLAARSPGDRQSIHRTTRKWLIEKMAKTAPKRRRMTKAEQRAETTEQILDEAEHLFAQFGFNGVTLKDVAKGVGVHHTLLNYYFDDKRSLFDAVIARRAGVTSSLRMRALDEYEEASRGKPTVEGALRAFLDTDLDLYSQGGQGWKNYGALGAQSSNTPYGAELFDFHFDPVVLRLIGLLQKALPECSREDLFWGYHFVTGALMLTLGRTGRIDRLSEGLCKSDDFEAVKARMASFMASGFHELCRKSKNNAP